MDATKMGNSSVDWTAAIDQLIEGRKLSARLGAILEEASPTGASRDLIKEISGSFSRALIALDYGVKTTDSFPGEKRKIRYEESGGRNRRKGNDSIKTIVVRTPEDGHSWRKYGQKMISNSEFPRGYYRCIYKHDQKCLAKRQVQQSKDDSSLFVITYVGEHTCQVLDSLEHNPCIIDFGSSAPTTTGTYTPGSCSSTHCIATQEMDTLDESELVQFVAELMGGASENGDAMPRLHPSSDHDEWYFVRGLFHEYDHLFGL